MALIIPTNDLEKLSRKKKTRKPIKSKIPLKPERDMKAKIDEFRKVIIDTVIDDFKLMLNTGASFVEMAEYLELKLNQIEYTSKQRADYIVNLWASEMDRETREKFDNVLSKSLGIDISAVLDAPEIKEALEMASMEAANLIRTIPVDFLGDIAQAVNKSFRGEDLPGGRTLFDQIKHVGNVTDNRARVIARDQTGKLFAVLDKMRQTSAGIEMYIWRTSKDLAVVGNPAGLYPKGNKKHGNHWKMEGKYCRWDDPSVYSDDGKVWKQRTSDMPKGHVGTEILCRCFPEPVINIDDIIQAAIAA